nr:Uncharacterised protein [Raoultella sp. NCTC 9187]
MSKRFHLALLPLLLGLSASALAKTPETVNIGYQKANIFRPVEISRHPR